MSTFLIPCVYKLYYICAPPATEVRPRGSILWRDPSPQPRLAPPPARGTSPALPTALHLACCLPSAWAALVSDSVSPVTCCSSPFTSQVPPPEPSRRPWVRDHDGEDTALLTQRAQVSGRGTEWREGEAPGPGGLGQLLPALPSHHPASGPGRTPLLLFPHTFLHPMPDPNTVLLSPSAQGSRPSSCPLPKPSHS